jgi:hypothetical protein
MNEWLQDKGKKRLSADEWVDVAERVLVCEDRYKAVWAELGHARDGAARVAGLRSLESALRDAVAVLQAVPAELDSD